MPLLPLLGIAAAFAALPGCGRVAGSDNSAAAEGDAAARPVAIERLDLRLAAGTDSLLESAADSTLFDALRFAFGRTDESLSDFAGGYAGSRAVAAFAPDVAQRLQSLAGAEIQLGHARRLWEEAVAGADSNAVAFPSRVVAVVSPFSQSVFSVDTILFLATNHFLGADYAGYDGFAPARRASRQPGRVASEAVEALVRSSYPGPDADATTLRAMVYEGAVIAAVERLTGSDDLTLSLATDPATLSLMEQSERRAWHALVEADLLYSADPSTVGRILSPYAVPPGQLGADLPAGIGRYLGRRIVGSLLQREPSLTLPALLGSATWADPAILARAAYAP